MSEPDGSTGILSPVSPKKEGRLPLNFASILAMVVTAVLFIYAAKPVQGLKNTEIVFTIFAFGAWLVYSLFFGFGFRATLMFSVLYFVKPLPVTFYGIILVFVFSYLMSFYERPRGLRLPYPFAFLILTAACVQGLARARDFGDALIYFTSTLLVPLISILYVNNLQARKGDFELWIRGLTVVAAILGFLGVILGLLFPDKRLGSLWFTAMTINGFYTMCFFFGLGLAMKSKDRREKFLWYLAVLLIFMGMMYTYTRIALVAVVLGMGLMMWRIKRFRWVGIFVLLLVPLAIPASMMTRIQSSFELDYSFFVRLLAWYHSSLQIASHPWFGIGIQTWKQWYIAIAPFDFLYAQHPHNVYIKILLEIGIFGFLAYFYIIWSILKNYYKTCIRGRHDSFDYMILLGMVTVLFACLTDIFIQQYEISVVFWLALAFIHQRVKKETCKNLIS